MASLQEITKFIVLSPTKLLSWINDNLISTVNSKSDSTHIHGNIQNDGTLQTTDVTIASGDKLVITDASNSNKVARTSVQFDGSTATQALTKKGTFETFNNYVHPSDGANTGSFGPDSDKSPGFGGTFSVPYVTVNSAGHVTAASSKTITLPSDSNTDTKVIQTLGSSNATYPILASAQSSPTSGTAYQAIYDSGIKINPNKHSVVEGGSGTATGSYSHAEGYSTTAEAWSSHSEGERTKVYSTGLYAHAEGVLTEARNTAEHAEGWANVSISGVTQHTVGIGTVNSDNSITRKNAHTITTDGKHYIPGVGTYQGTETTLPSGQDLASIIDGKANISDVVTLTNAQTITGVKTFNPSSGTVPFALNSAKTGLISYLNADRVDSYHAYDITNIYAGSNCANGVSGDFWFKAAEFYLESNNTIDAKATFLVSSYYNGDSDRPGIGILSIQIRGDNSTTPFNINKTTATWSLLNTNLNDIIKVKTYYDNSGSTLKRYVRIYTNAGGWNRGVGIKLLNSHTWSSTNTTNWTMYNTPSTIATAADYSYGTELSIGYENIRASRFFNGPGNETHLGDSGNGDYTYLDEDTRVANAISGYDIDEDEDTWVINNSGNASGFGQISCTKVQSSQGFFQTSDIRKKNVLSELSLDKAYDLVDKCQTILYTLKEDTTNKQQIGLIAQEVKEFFPEIVSEDENGMLSLDYARLTVVILSVLKDVIDRVKKLENK